MSMILLLRMMASESSAKTVQTLSATNKRTDVIIAAELKWPHISIGIGDGLPAMKAQRTIRGQLNQSSNSTIYLAKRRSNFVETMSAVLTGSKSAPIG